MANKPKISADPVGSMDQLVRFFNQYIPLSLTEREKLISRVTEKLLKRRQFILQPGDVCKYNSFVVSGCLRMYGVSKDGVDHNLQFAAENDWIVDIGSFHPNRESHLYIEALEPSVILQINKADLIYLYQYHPKFDRIFRIFIENKFVELQGRVLQNIGATTEERYLDFLAQYPTLATRLPSIQIASYLGITPEFLSKLRKSIAHK